MTTKLTRLFLPLFLVAYLSACGPGEEAPLELDSETSNIETCIPYCTKWIPAPPPRYFRCAKYQFICGDFCNSDSDCSSGKYCDNGQCKIAPCGAEGEACCLNESPENQCDSGLECKDNGLCKIASCGAEGEACCLNESPKDQCDSGLECNEDSFCIPFSLISNIHPAKEEWRSTNEDGSSNYQIRVNIEEGAAILREDSTFKIVIKKGASCSGPATLTPSDIIGGAAKYGTWPSARDYFLFRIPFSVQPGPNDITICAKSLKSSFKVNDFLVLGNKNGDLEKAAKFASGSKPCGTSELVFGYNSTQTNHKVVSYQNREIAQMLTNGFCSAVWVDKSCRNLIFCDGNGVWTHLHRYNDSNSFTSVATGWRRSDDLGYAESTFYMKASEDGNVAFIATPSPDGYYLSGGAFDPSGERRYKELRGNFSGDDMMFDFSGKTDKDNLLLKTRAKVGLNVQEVLLLDIDLRDLF